MLITFYAFLRHSDSFTNIIGIKGKISFALKAFLLKLFLLIPVMLFINLLTDKGLISDYNFNNLSFNNNFFILFVFVGLIHPIIEELAFRLAITKKLAFFNLGLSFFAANILTLNFHLEAILPFTGLTAFPIIVSALAVPLYYILAAINKKTIHKKNIFIYLHILTIFFAAGHFNSFIPDGENILSFILYTPYLIMGYIYAFCRVNAGIITSIICHAFSNSLGVLAAYFY